MPSHRFHQLDVFTRIPLAGNPLAVFPDAAGLDADTLQRLAREMNLSETAFVTTSDVATRRVRFFTPTAEIPLAGHPTIGTWWLLADLGQLDLPPDGTARVTQETGGGVLGVDIHLEAGKPTEVAMMQPLPQFGPIAGDRDTLGDALGASGEIIGTDPLPQLVETALPQVMIPIRSREDLHALPSGGTGGRLAAVLDALGSHCAMCYTLESSHEEPVAHCRMFAPGLGVPEDPGTGSAAGALATYLVWHGSVRPHDGVATVIVEQGGEIGRPCRIRSQVAVGNGGEITEVRVGGEAIQVITGEVHL